MTSSPGCTQHRMAVIGGYWFNPFCIACVTASTSAGSQSKSGKPCPRFTAFFSAANADITVKTVVPTRGKRDWGTMERTENTEAVDVSAGRCMGDKGANNLEIPL